MTAALRAEQLPFMLIGGQAVLRHGEPRLTEDIDVTVGATPNELPRLLAACARMRLVPLPEDVTAFVAETFVLPARDPDTGVRFDFIFSSTEYERTAIARAESVDVGGESVPFATAEDLILHKLFAGRARDIEDVEGVVRRNSAALDWSYLERWADDFAKVPGREGMSAQVRTFRGRWSSRG